MLYNHILHASALIILTVIISYMLSINVINIYSQRHAFSSIINVYIIIPRHRVAQHAVSASWQQHIANVVWLRQNGWLNAAMQMRHTALPPSAARRKTLASLRIAGAGLAHCCMAGDVGSGGVMMMAP
jgi:hypothetical protein